MPGSRVKTQILRAHFHTSEICAEVSLTMPEVMRTLIMKLPHTEVKFYPEVKSQTGLSSLRVSCKRALNARHSKNDTCSCLVW